MNQIIMYGYFEIQAKIDIIKHHGGLEVTRKFLNLNQVQKSDQQGYWV